LRRRNIDARSDVSPDAKSPPLALKSCAAAGPSRNPRNRHLARGVRRSDRKRNYFKRLAERPPVKPAEPANNDDGTKVRTGCTGGGTRSHSEKRVPLSRPTQAEAAYCSTAS
jgi:hypothetical protein